MFTAPFNTRTESGEHLEWNWIPQFEALPGPFEVSEGVVIPPGRYTFHRFRTIAIYNRGWNRVSGTLVPAFEKSAIKLQWAFRP